MKFFAIMFSVIVMALAVVPCCVYDQCDNEQTQEPKSDKPEIPCSPFINCTCSPTGVCIPPFMRFDYIPVTAVIKNKSQEHQSFISFYCSTIWQPPKPAC